MCNGNIVEIGESKAKVPIKRIQNIETSDRKKRGIGVGIFVREDTRYLIKQNSNDNYLQLITVELNCKTKLNLTCLYSPSRACQKTKPN